MPYKGGVVRASEGGANGSGWATISRGREPKTHGEEVWDWVLEGESETGEGKGERETDSEDQ